MAEPFLAEIRLMSFVFISLPEHRRQGLGASLMRDLLDEAAAAGKPLTIHVEKNNPAMGLYRRLGFVTAEDKGVYDLLRWSAQANTAS